MMTRKFLKLITMVAGILTATASFALNGDIFEIRPCDETGKSVDPYATIENPVTSAGKDFYFNIRLIARKPDDPDSVWYLKYIGSSGELMDNALNNKLKIRIYVSGKPVDAVLHDCKSGLATESRDADGTGIFTDLIFKYEVKAGDVAFPIVLGTKDGPVTDTPSDGLSYQFLNTDKWVISSKELDGSGDSDAKCRFWFWDLAATDNPYLWEDRSPAGGTAKKDYSLRECGFYVKTIDFDSNWEIPEGGAEAPVWRSVHQGSTKIVSGLPVQLKSVGNIPVEDELELYVWSENEDVFKVESNEKVTLKLDADGTEKEVNIGRIRFSKGQIEPVDFEIRGVAQGGTTNLVLSTWPNYTYYVGRSDRIIDYITVPVKCDKPLPPTIEVKVTSPTDDAAAVAGSDYLKAAATLAVSVSEPYPTPLEVKITPTFSNGAAAEMNDYVRLYEKPSVGALQGQAVGTVTIPANSTAPVIVYVYCLRSDENTTGGAARIVFSPSCDDTDAKNHFGDHLDSDELEVVAAPAAIAARPVSGVCGEDIDLLLEVKDTYADMNDAKTGYQIYVRYSESEDFKLIPGRYYVGANNYLRKLAEGSENPKTSEFPKLNYSLPGSFVSEVYVVPPISYENPEDRVVATFNAEIRAPRTASWEEVNGKDSFYETVPGVTVTEETTAKVKVSISEPDNTRDLWAFLKTSDLKKNQVNSKFVICSDTGDAASDRVGLKIGKGSTDVSGSIQFLDGASEDYGGLSAAFEVVICSQQTYSKTAVVSGYNSTPYYLTIFNKKPIVDRIDMNGSRITKVNDTTYRVPNAVPKGLSRSFSAVVKDSTYDKTTTEEDKEFECRWTTYVDGMLYEAKDDLGKDITPVTIKGDPADKSFSFDFPIAGEWTITLYVKDKDMDDWAETEYTVNVTVLDNPVVEVVALPQYLETDNKGEINVRLSYWDPMYRDKLKVKLTVENVGDGDTNYGILKLDSTYRSKEPGEENVYYVDLDQRTYVSFPVRIEEMDGTQDSETYGFRITADVVNADDANPTMLPTVKEPADTYYINQSTQVFVYNVAPEYTITEPNTSTNRYVVSGGICTSHPIRWNIRKDVQNDYEGTWAKVATNGVRIAFQGALNEENVFYVSEATSGTFEPNFGDLQGDIEVTVMVEDKDGGGGTHTYYYTVTPSKFLVTSAHGPGGGLGNSPLSNKYRGLGTLGEGHTFVKKGAATFSNADNFRLTWNCGKAIDVEAFAFGYKINDPVDDGSLNDNQDIAITPTGFYQPDTAAGPFYTYPLAADTVLYKDQKDSFFYCWLLHKMTKEGQFESSVLDGTFIIELPGSAVPASRIPLPNEKTEDGNYLRTEIEAIFAREYYREDNAGDVNYDGIPDTFAHKQWQGGNMIELATGGTVVENNLVGLAGFNGDNDRLPKVYEGGQNNFNHAPIGPALNASMEIRGFHKGLNAIDGVTSDACFADLDDNGELKKDNNGRLVNANELLAWRAFMKARYDEIPDDPVNPKEPFNEDMKPTADDLKLWSPEPRGSEIARMDPTVEDTDGDGFPDGWEYYFWYRAHVTARIPDSNVRFEKFNINNILVGLPISADEVEARFNPCEKLTPDQYGDNPDFDGDGLSDLEELAIGTNPCHWDTDGDKMCDGWEVMMNLNPLMPTDKRANLDGDFMAYLDMGGVPAVDNGDGTVTFYPQLVIGLDYTIELQEGAEGEEPTPVATTFVFVRDVKNTVALTVRGLVNTWTEVDENGNDVQKEEPVCYGLAGEGQIWGGQLAVIEERTLVNFKSGSTIADLSFGHPYVLLHDQVRRALGFDPRTAWSSVEGYVATRWNPEKNSQFVDGNPLTGVAVNTRAYEAYDEYLVMKYRLKVLGEDGFNANDPWGTIMAKTTNPSVIEPEIIDTNDDVDDSIDGIAGNDSTNVLAGVTTNVTTNAGSVTQNMTAQGVLSELLDKAFAEVGSNKVTKKNHGADTDGDGVPDGWELYMKRNPSAAPGEEEDGSGEDGLRDYDGDGLGYVLEYAGTDSCEAYRDCPSIYAHHPGHSSGWYNKFFPTNPGGKESLELAVEGVDTDADGIEDSKEGGTFPMDFYNAGAFFHELSLSFIYGNIEDDSRTVCFRGGGMNPCTMDTDVDGIPDGWEMQHAGVPVNARTKTVVPPGGLDNEAASKLSDITKHFNDNPGTFIADGIFNRVASTNDTSNAIYIAGGMDATWKGDAKSDLFDQEAAGSSWDALLGTRRDIDFDHDGLQNYQEYLIQAVRHFRYDDISTPLMGRLLTEKGTVQDVEDEFGIPVPTVTAAAHTQEFLGYVPFDPADPTNFVTMAENVWGASKVRACVEYVKPEDSPLVREPWTVEGWRNLGYFAPTVRDWDLAAANLYMFPVTKKMSFSSAVAGYVATDPRIVDTDGDGMDDFYEMFHGLNPILGTNADQPDETIWAYFAPKKGDMISAVYNQANMDEMRGESLGTFNAYYNEWIYSSFRGTPGRLGETPCDYDPIKAPMAYDPVMYPWLQGTAMVDCDGDGLRNDQERILANVADPKPRHTDPTPLWFTERATPLSYVSQYYIAPVIPQQWFERSQRNGKFSTLASANLSNGDFMFSFEEGEGYDTDGDFKYDGAEVITAFTRESDPLKFDDPSRRQALWLDGKNSYALSAQMQERPEFSQDLLKQFTVECWICPEKEDEAQTVIDRSVAYIGDSLSSDAAAIRANFRIGISAEGKIYGMFDNDHSIESGANTTVSCQYVWGRKLNVNEWAHVALTFDGSVLRLYIDGEEASYANTSLIPANGVTMISQNPGSASSFENPGYANEPAALFIGARPVKASNVSVSGMPEAAFMPYIVDEDGNHYPETFDNVREFFGGYVDEVRVWDGARTAEEIKANYRKRFGFDEATENRDNVMRSWMYGGTRNNNDGMETLPAELLFHYNFVTLPGAADPKNVAKTPAAFGARVVDVVNGKQYDQNNAEISTAGLYDAKTNRSRSIETDMCAKWWIDSKLRNTVYNDYRVIPWIKNTVMHLTPVDGSALDTFLYTSEFGSGYIPAQLNGLTEYDFANTAQPYSSYVLHFDLFQRYLQSLIIGEQFGEGYERVQLLAEFNLRSAFEGTTDLLPLGGAYAKSCEKMWDRAASDAWELTGSDSDADGLTDWWEEYCRTNYGKNLSDTDPISWDTIVDYKGSPMTAGQAYFYDIMSGMQPSDDGTINEALKSTIDSDGDNLPDWWETFYGINEFTDVDDNDGDGLSNWAEYLLSEVFVLTNENGARIKFNPNDAKSVNGFDLDYFFKIGKLYAGEIFTDHDFMDDIQEDAWGKAYTSRYAWDAAADTDEDGWSNFAEARYNDFTKSIVAPNISHVVGDSEIKDMPIPTMRLTLRYNGDQPLTGEDDDGNQGGNDQGNGAQVSGSLAPIVVQTFTDGKLNSPDATFTVQPGEESEQTTYIGAWGEKTVSGTLTPGYVNGTSLKLEFAEVDRNDNYSVYIGDLSEVDPAFAAKTQPGYYVLDYETYMTLYSRYGAQYIVLQAGEFHWSNFENANVITVTQDEAGEKGFICNRGGRIGTINLKTGDYTLDLTPLQYQGAQGTNDTQAVVSMSQMVLRFKYNSVVPALQNHKLDLFLGETDKGFVKEGKNTIVAFYDLDSNGRYTPGEPMGVAVGVDVGWRQGKVEMELTDTHPIITRMQLTTGESDRDKLWGEESGDAEPPHVGAITSEDYQRVRIVRTLINDQPAWLINGIPTTCVFDGILNLKSRDYISEADILQSGEFDLDWSFFDKEASGKLQSKGVDAVKVGYAVILGNGDIDLTQTNNYFSVCTVRHFDAKDKRPAPIAISPGVEGSVVRDSSPTFTWKMPNNADTYTVFKVQILDIDGSTVWDSGYRRAPARNKEGVYTFKADAYIGDKLENSKNYKWRVSMYNSKFKGDLWSEGHTFRMEALENGAGYGSIPVSVKYFGPETVAADSTFVVEAFTTPDFTGTPVARVVVDDAASVTAAGVSHATNAVMKGLAAGKYFLRAYADLATAGAVERQRDSFESWGYACGRGKRGSGQFTPTEFELTGENGFEKPIDIYIEDVDTNGNCLPDAWEYVSNGGKLDDGATNLDGTLVKAFSVNQALTDNLQGKVVSDTRIDAYNNYIMTAFASPRMTALALGYDPSDVTVGANGSIQVESKVESVEIKSVSFNADGNVVVEIEGELNTAEGNTNGLGFIPLEGETKKTVTCQVFWKASLSDADWTVKATKTIVVGDGAQTIDIKGLGAESSGFFKVVVTE